MIEDLVKNTNSRIVETMSKQPTEILLDHRFSYISVTDKMEMSAFIGLMYLRGMRGAALEDLRSIYSLSDGIPAFAAVMSKSRFFFLLTHLTFESKEKRIKRKEQWKSDR